MDSPVSPLAPPPCRHCGHALDLPLADLGLSPVANDYVAPQDYARGEAFYPLEVWVCRHCRLAQTRDLLAAEAIFRADYAYFSSVSSSWLAHARAYVEAMLARLRLRPGERHVEIASNDGYLLQYSQAAGLDCLGVEPCESVAQAALDKGIPTRIAFFDPACAEVLLAEGGPARLITANNVLAHVPDLNGFVSGVKRLLAADGVATFEVQHLLRLMQRNQFDTIYHEHFSYFSLIAARHVFASAGLRVFDVDELETHGGSIRFLVCHADAEIADTPALERVLAEERAYGLDQDAAYLAWNESVKRTKRALLALLARLKDEGRRIVAYGAPAKGVTLLNYCGIGRDFLEFTVDRAPSKQGRFLPGVRVPILAPEALDRARPDYVLILVWNLRQEVKAQLAHVRDWGGRFIVPLPQAAIED
ncbi:class I SAM-dependent methyltransferase [Xanthomonas massiliensis]|uniref:class I SAM-dependent methyltransferase n=1 Tax=Xanthomonas massiliensis TaxID=1720302 RepID=UPI0008261ECA|nr:class I SAM-dependent methyltransferase [Xanthomonas massiliensis]